MKRLILTAIIALLAVSTTKAATTVFTDEDAFKAAIGLFTVHDFDSFELNEGPDIFGNFQTLDQQIPGIDFDNARVNIGAFGGTSNSSPNVVLNADFISAIVINFDQLQRGVGLFNTSIVDAERFEVFDTNDTLLGTIDLPDQVINFGGFISDEGISKAVITPIAPTNGSIFIDDLTVSAIPLPASFLLFGSGLLGLVSIARKKA
jgi:hypothetical protein